LKPWHDVSRFVCSAVPRRFRRVVGIFYMQQWRRRTPKGKSLIERGRTMLCGIGMVIAHAFL
jgi:hypothetical protein